MDNENVLYRLELKSSNTFDNNTKIVYVLAQNPDEAEKSALSYYREKYKNMFIFSYAIKIERIASDKHKGPKRIIINY